MIGTWWHHYWSWVGGNIGAMPLQAVIAGAAGVAFRKPLRRAYHAIVGERADLEDLRRAATAAHKIAADLFEHHTGEKHPHSPGTESEGK
jgi:hypothetical protein